MINYIIITLIAIALGFALKKVIYDLKNNKCSCGSSCSGCSSHEKSCNIENLEK